MASANFQPAFHALAIINLIGASQALLIAAALFSAKHGSRTANRCFAVFLTAFSVYIIMAVLLETGYIVRAPHLMNFDNPFLFMMGPCLYLYVRAATGESFKLRGQTLLHFLPSALFALIWIVTLFIGAEAKIAEYIESLSRLDRFNPEKFILYLLLDVWLFAYVIAGLRKLRRADSGFFERDGANRRWLRNLLVALLAMLAFSTVLDFLALDRINLRFTPLLGTIILCSLGYLGLRQSGMIAPSASARAGKYAKSTLTEEMAAEIFRKLQQAMQQEKLFADSTLSLPKLAKKLGVSTHHLSQLINERFEQNFFNYLSSVRIEEAKKLLRAPSSGNLALSEIAYTVGFNSLSAFSATFKKQSGMSPSQFQKQHAG